MPVNRNALIRFKTIDKCLQNRYRKWTLEDLINECSDALYEYEGIDKGVSRRSIQADIQLMRSDKLGYNAPIVVVDKKYYTYEDPEYSITNIPLTDQDLGMLGEAVEFLKQFQGFSHFRELDGMVQKLEDHIYSQKGDHKPVIDFEKNENLKGLEYLDRLYQAIINRKAIRLTYQSFNARHPNTFDFHPCLLKEFRNRWFLLGKRRKKDMVLNLALDRIVEIDGTKTPYIDMPDFDAQAYFRDVIGVSVSPNIPPEKVLLFITRKHAPYVLTKPLHHSQQLVEEGSYGVTISLDVVHNFELEKEILGLGDGVRVIAPEKLKHSIRERLSAGIDLYETELNTKGLNKAVKRLEHKGYSVLGQAYTKRELKRIGSLIDKYLAEQPEKPFAIRRLLKAIPDLKEQLFLPNLKRIIKSIDKDAFLVKAIYFDKPADQNWYVAWHQDVPVNVMKKKKVEGYGGWTKKSDVVSVRPPEAINKNVFSIRIHLDQANIYNGCLRVLPGSHTKQMTSSEIQLISTNSVAVDCEVDAGGVMLMKPLLLHSSGKSTSQKRRRVIHLEFASVKLAGGLKWEEKEEVVL